MKKGFPLAILVSAALLCGRDSWGQAAARRVTRDDAVKEAATLQQHTNIALLVAIGDYDRSLTGLPPLKYPVPDIMAIAGVLKQEGYEIATLTDRSATAGTIRETFQELTKALDQGEGTFLFYFSGHGFRTGSENYLATFGTTAADLANQGLSLSDVQKLLLATGAKRRLAFIDACRNDPDNTRSVTGAARRSFQELKDSEGLRIMYSTAPGEVSYEDDDLQHGVFSYFLLDGLRGKAANPSDGLITFDDLLTYVNREMRSYGISKRRVQKPYQLGDSTGDFLLARVSPGGTVPMAVPPANPKPIVAPAAPPALPTPDTETAVPKGGGIGEIKTASGSLDSLPQVWRNVANNDLYKFRFDSEHLIIYHLKSNQVIADLALKHDKKDSRKDKYVGTTSLSKCRGGQMEVLNWSATRIEAKIEVPDAANNCNQAGRLILFRTMVNASFIPEDVTAQPAEKRRKQ